MQTDNKKLITDFIDQIWNKQNFTKLEDFLHPEFKDNSLPPMFSPDKDGLKKWVLNTGLSFEHETIVEDQVAEGDKSIVKIKMALRHVGTWRDIEATGIDLTTNGYRHFKIKEGKIVEHWALINGQSIENQLKTAEQVFKSGK